MRLPGLLGALAVAAAAGPALADEVEWRVPFITTPGEVVERMLELAGTGSGDLVVDLGSGDGRIVIIAAQKFGARGLGIELDQRLVEKSRANARAANVADRVSFVQGDVLAAEISQASVVTVYLLPSLIGQLQPRFIGELKPGTRIVSHAFSMTGWKPDRMQTVRLAKPHPGQGDESTLYLWVVPADVRGVWRGGEWQLRIEQNYQQIEIEGAAEARLSGRDITWEARGIRFHGRVDGERMAGEVSAAGGTRPLVLTRSR
jgi:SAM-dependent methyltransferase